MKKTILFFALIELFAGGFWVWSADNWRMGCLIAPLLMVAAAVIACGIIESNEQ